MQLQEDRENRFYVYALVDPINNVPFYIGKGTGGRAFQHFRKSEKCNTKKLKYRDSIKMLGFAPKVSFIAEKLNEVDAYSIESDCIRLAKTMGLPITNSFGIDPPNRTGKKMPLSAKLAISNFQRNNIKRPIMKESTKMKISNTLRGKPSYTSTIVICPQCNKSGSNRGMYRWHFGKCKS